MDEMPQRRATDSPIHQERLAILEVNVVNVRGAVDEIKDDLKAHISEETEIIRGIGLSIQRVADATDVNKTTMERMSGTIDQIAAQNLRVHSLEEFRARTEPRLDEFHRALDEASEKVKRIYWLAPIAASVIAAAWAVVTHLGWM